MTRDDLIRMAREAGWQYADDDRGYEPLWRFASLVAAAEREECAKVCEDFDFEFQDDSAGTLQGAAEAVRARRPKLKPCRSPYCECDHGKCSHPGFYDARGEPWPPAQRKPLTDELLRKMHHEDQFGLFCDYDEFEQIARAIEAAHGIN